MVNVRFIRINNSINYSQVLNDKHYATAFISRRIKRDTVLSKNLARPNKFVGSPSHQMLQSSIVEHLPRVNNIGNLPTLQLLFVVLGEHLPQTSKAGYSPYINCYIYIYNSQRAGPGLGNPASSLKLYNCPLRRHITYKP